MIPEHASNNGIIDNYCSNLQTFLLHGIQWLHGTFSLCEFWPNSGQHVRKPCKDRWAEGKGSNTLLCLSSSLHGSGSLAPVKGREISAHPGALSSATFAENTTFPNRIGTHFQSWMREKPEASFLGCLKTDEAVTHLINHIIRMQRSKNNLRFSQVLKWGH